jgi:hypothetical protein
MPKIAYAEQRFNGSSMEVIRQAVGIAETYAAQGYDLTLRQTYYQFVARDFIPNSQKEYKRLGSILNNARNAGYYDWLHMVDRTRNIVKATAWDSPSQIISASAQQFKRDLWVTTGQRFRPQVWVEKDALEGVIGRPCDELRVPYLSCRGYVSQSQMWQRGREIGRQISNGLHPVIIHLGDHDPSGIDMSRDIQERLSTYAGYRVDVRRVALTMDQVRELNPPPNPAKESDARFEGYRDLYGDESWELDALEPSYIDNLVREHVAEYVDAEQWQYGLDEEQEVRDQMGLVADRWDDLSNDWDQIVRVLDA